MIKLTELKRLIKTNKIVYTFYVESLCKVTFNYNNKLILNLQGIDTKKFYEYIKSLNMCNDEYIIDSIYLDNESRIPNLLKTLFEQIKDNEPSLILETGIQYKSMQQGRQDYIVFKSNNGLIKIEFELISLLDINKYNLYVNKELNIVYINTEYNDFIGVCHCNKFELSELNENIQI
jgi:hypothetical protein